MKESQDSGEFVSPGSPYALLSHFELNRIILGGRGGGRFWLTVIVEGGNLNHKHTRCKLFYESGE